MKSLLNGIDLIADLINAGSLVDPVTSRSGDYAFSEDLRLSGQFPKVYIEGEMPDADKDYTFGEAPESISSGTINIYYFVKLSRENIYTDSDGSYKNERLVHRFLELIRDMINSSGSEFKKVGLSNFRITTSSKITPNRDLGLLVGNVTITCMWRNI